MIFRRSFADDIFISYTRRDSSTDAGLADELTKLHYSCFIERLGTEATLQLPDSLLHKLRSCTLLVVVGTNWSGTRKTIKDEIIEFKKVPGRIATNTEFRKNNKIGVLLLGPHNAINDLLPVLFKISDVVVLLR